MIAGYKQIAERIDALSLRERAMVFVGVLGLLFALVNTTVFPGLQAEEKRLRNELAATQQQTATMQAFIHEAAGRHGSDPNAAARARIQSLKQLLGDQASVSAVVAPSEMAKLVKAVLVQHGTVSLVRLQNLPAEPFGNSNTPETAVAKPVAVSVVPVATLYRHGVKVEVQGGYADLVSYLQALERLPWRVMWGEVQLTVEKHPTSRLTLTLYTLSSERAWIGM